MDDDNQVQNVLRMIAESDTKGRLEILKIMLEMAQKDREEGHVWELFEDFVEKAEATIATLEKRLLQEEMLATKDQDTEDE